MALLGCISTAAVVCRADFYENALEFTDQTWARVQQIFADFLLRLLFTGLIVIHSLNWFAQLPPSTGPDDVGGSIVRGRWAWGGGKRSWGGLGRQEVWQGRRRGGRGREEGRPVHGWM